MVENYAPHELLRTHHPDLNLVAMPNVSSTLQALATGEVDTVVSDLASSVWSLRELKLDGLIRQRRYPLPLSIGDGSATGRQNDWWASWIKSWPTSAPMKPMPSNSTG